MDRREAIELLKPFRNCMLDQYGCPISDVVFALDLAIEALKTMRCGDCKYYDLVCGNGGNEWEVCKREPEEYRWFEVKAMDIMCEKGEVRE